LRTSRLVLWLLLLPAALSARSPVKMPASVLPGVGNSFYSPQKTPFMPALTAVLQAPEEESVPEFLPVQPDGGAEPEELPVVPGPPDSVTLLLQAILSSPRPPGGDSSGGRILRFAVNGADVLRDCRNVTLSFPGGGLLLVSGERRFIREGRVIDEGFHVLARPRGVSPGEVTYDAALMVSQGGEPTGGLSGEGSVRAFRTGSILSIRGAGNGAALDMLIDLGQNAGEGP
jgi:hypothetical protein